jgi:hypothetical protein
VANVREQVAKEKATEFEWTWSEEDAHRVVAEGRKLGLGDQQIKDLIRIAQRKDQVGELGKVSKKAFTAPEMIQQMHNYVEVVLPQGHPYRISSKEQFAELGNDLRSAAARSGLPIDDIRIQGSALRNPDAKDIDIAILIDDRSFDAQLIKTFEGNVSLRNGTEIPLSLDTLEATVMDIARDNVSGRTRYTAEARTMMHAYTSRKIRVDDLPALKASKQGMKSRYGAVDISVMARGAHLDRNPTMQVP